MELITAFFKIAEYPPAATTGGIKIVDGEMGNVFQRSEPTCVFYLSLVVLKCYWNLELV